MEAISVNVNRLARIPKNGFGESFEGSSHGGTKEVDWKIFSQGFEE